MFFIGLSMSLWGHIFYIKAFTFFFSFFVCVIFLAHAFFHRACFDRERYSVESQHQQSIFGLTPTLVLDSMCVSIERDIFLDSLIA